MVGLAMVHMFGIFPHHPLWAWIDPGAMALIGAASFFGGVSRLTMSLTVIMVSNVVSTARSILQLTAAEPQSMIKCMTNGGHIYVRVWL